jgi:hypothetical protein
VLRRDSIGAASARVLYFSATTDGQVRLKVQATGLNVPESLGVLRASSGVVEHGEIVLAVLSGGRYELVVEFDNPYDGPVELVGTQHPLQASA